MSIENCRIRLLIVSLVHALEEYSSSELTLLIYLLKLFLYVIERAESNFVIHLFYFVISKLLKLKWRDYLAETGVVLIVHEPVKDLAKMLKHQSVESLQASSDKEIDYVASKLPLFFSSCDLDHWELLGEEDHDLVNCHY